ncbi:MAG: hypothetical protein LLG24_05195 [Actinomycetia bacterium]|nr:hypothetical protein [Actinomycetes bacterium]
MSRVPQMPPAMMAAFAGMRSAGGLAGAYAVAYVMYTLAPYTPPEGRRAERAAEAATRFRLSQDLSAFLPPEPGRFARRARKDAYKGVVMALKSIDELEGDERAEAIAQVATLLGASRR